MRRDNKLNTRKAKIIARTKYVERQLEKWIKWRIDVKGGLKYEQLKQKQDEYRIKCLGWQRT